MTAASNMTEAETSNAFLNAASSGLAEQVSQFLRGEKGTFDVNVQGKKDNMQTALEIACLCGHTSVAELLLNDERTDLTLRHPLHVACKHGRIDIVRLFLELYQQQQNQHTDYQQEDRRGDQKKTASRIPTHRTLDIEATDRQGYTPLLVSIRHGHQNIVQELLKAGADPLVSLPPMFPAEVGKSALILACSHALWPIAQTILEHIPAKEQFSSINQGDPASHMTPLMYAAKNSARDMVVELLLLQAKVDEVDWFGETALFQCCDKDTMKVLIDHGAHVDAINHKGDTALHVAIKSKPLSVIQALIECGANIHLPNREGLFPIHLVAHRSMEGILFSLSYGKPYNVLQELQKLEKVSYETPVKKRLRTNDPSSSSRFDLLTEFQKISIETPTLDHEQQTLLHIACRRFHTSLVRKLLSEHGANLHAVDIHGNTPLHLVCAERSVWNDKLPLVKLLLEYLPDVHAANKQGETPLVLAATSMNTLSLDVIWLLVLRGVEAYGCVVPPTAVADQESLLQQDDSPIRGSTVSSSSSPMPNYVPRVSESPRDSTSVMSDCCM